MVWKCVTATRWFAYQDEIQVGGVFEDSSGGLKAWVWPLDKADKVWFDSCITVARAKEEVEDYLGR